MKSNIIALVLAGTLTVASANVQAENSGESMKT